MSFAAYYSDFAENLNIFAFMLAEVCLLSFGFGVWLMIVIISEFQHQFRYLLAMANLFNTMYGCWGFGTCAPCLQMKKMKGSAASL